jgi:hypothetical protein
LSKCENFIVNVALPCEEDLKSVEYPKSEERGAFAMIS